MKKAAKSVGEKSVSMLHVKDINTVTRLHQRRLHRDRYEKAVRHAHRPKVPKTSIRSL